MIWTIIVLVMALIFLPPVVLGETLYWLPRNSKYPDIPEFNPVQVETDEGLRLQGWYTDEYDSVLIIVHGHAKNSHVMWDAMDKKLEGIDRLYIDLRNHGRSSRKPPVTLGFGEGADVAAFVNWAGKRWERVLVYGTSMGAVASLAASDAERVILDSMFIHPQLVMEGNFKKNHVPQPWRSLLIYYLLKFRSTHYRSIRNMLIDINIPVLVLHGDSDVESNQRVLKDIENIGNPLISTCLIPSGEHSMLHVNPQFWERVKSFMEVKYVES